MGDLGINFNNGSQDLEMYLHMGILSVCELLNLIMRRLLNEYIYWLQLKFDIYDVLIFVVTDISFIV